MPVRTPVSPLLSGDPFEVQMRLRRLVYKAGMKYADVATAVGCSRGLVTQFIKRDVIDSPALIRYFESLAFRLNEFTDLRGDLQDNSITAAGE